MISVELFLDRSRKKKKDPRKPFLRQELQNPKFQIMHRVEREGEKPYVENWQLTAVEARVLLKNLAEEMETAKSLLGLYDKIETALDYVGSMHDSLEALKEKFKTVHKMTDDAFDEFCDTSVMDIIESDLRDLESEVQ